MSMLSNFHMFRSVDEALVGLNIKMINCYMTSVLVIIGREKELFAEDVGGYEIDLNNFHP